MIVLNALLPIVGSPYELWSFQFTPLLINSINLKRDGVRICLGKDVGKWSIEGFLTPPSFRHRVNYMGNWITYNIPRSSRVARSSDGLWMLPGWWCIAIAALELGNGDSWCHMCAFRFYFWGRKVNWNQASHVRSSSTVPHLILDSARIWQVMRTCG